MRPVKTVIDAYLKFRLAEGKSLESYQYLNSHWRKSLGQVPIRQVSADLVEGLLDAAVEERSLAPASRNNMLTQLSGLFKWAVTKRWIDAHPFKGRIPRLQVDNARERWLTPEEIEKVKAHCKPWLCRLIDFSVRTGMRLSESTGLTVGDYQQDSRANGFVVVRNTKNGSDLTYPMVGATKDMVLESVRRASKASQLIFPGPGGGNAQMSLKRHFRIAVEAAGFEYGRTKTGVTWHTLRHTMASLAVNNGIPIELVQRMGNWKSRSMVERYAHMSDDTLRDAVDKLDRVF